MKTKLRARRLPVRVATLIAAVWAVAAARGEELRVWKDSSGKFEVQASFDRLEKDVVVLKKADGNLIRVPLERLSQADRDAVTRLNENPFESTALAPKLTAAQSLVLVTAKLGELATTSPGIVVRIQGKRAYVTVNVSSPNLSRVIGGNSAVWQPETNAASPPVTEKTLKPEFDVRWGDPAKPSKTAAELVGFLPAARRLILSAPADGMPPALDTSARSVRDEQPVRLIGFESDGSANPSFARVSGAGTVRKVFRDADGLPMRIHVTTDLAAANVFGLVVGDDGKPLGLLGNQVSGLSGNNGLPGNSGLPGNNAALIAGANPGAGREVIASPLASLPEYDAPEVLAVVLVPLDGNEKTVEYEFVLQISDPFGKLESPRLSITPMPSRFNQVPQVAGAENPAKDAVELNLTTGDVSPLAARLIARTPQAALGKSWVARHTAPKPALAAEHRFIVHLVLPAAGGKSVHLPNLTAEYNPRRVASFLGDQPTPEVPIPGLNGPVGAPAVVPHKDGGWQLTSKATRSDVSATPAPKSYPKPSKPARALGSKSYLTSGWQAIQLDVPSQVSGSHDRSRAPMAYSADGKWLYLIDGKQMLRKIESGVWVDETSLQLESACNDVAFSKAGIVVAANSTNQVMVLNSDTLEIQHLLPVGGLRDVSGSPASTIGFAIGSAKTGFGRGSTELSMLDLAKGKVLHRIQESVDGGRTLQISGRSPLSEHYLGLRQSPDGKYLYSAGRQIARFRVEGEDLIYEESSGDLQNGHTSHFILSSDGNFAAMPTGGGNKSGYDISVLNAKKLSEEVVALATGAYPCAIGFDAKTGNIYAPNHDQMIVFTSGGRKQLEFKHLQSDIRRILVHPKGEQFIVWGNERVIAFMYQEPKK